MVGKVGDEKIPRTIVGDSRRLFEACVSPDAVFAAIIRTGTSQSRDLSGCDDDPAYVVVSRISKEKIACAIAGHSRRREEVCIHTDAVLAVSLAKSAGDRGDDSGGDDNLSYGAVALLAHEEVAGAIGGYPGRIVEQRCSSRPVNPARIPRGTSQGRDHSSGHRDLANRVIVHVGDKDITGAIAGHVEDTTKLCGGPRAIHIAGLSWGSSQGGDHSSRDDDLSYRVDSVGHEKVAQAVTGHTHRGPELCTGPHPIQTVILCSPGMSSQGGYDSGAENDLANRAVVPIGDEEIACPITGHTPGCGKSGGSADPVLITGSS